MPKLSQSQHHVLVEPIPFGALCPRCSQYHNCDRNRGANTHFSSVFSHSKAPWSFCHIGL